MKNSVKIGLLCSAVGLSLIPVFAHPIAAQTQTASKQSEDFYDEEMNKAHDGVASFDTTNPEGINYKIDITTSELEHYQTFRVRDFYQERQKFEELKQNLINHPNILFDWSSDVTDTKKRSIKDIWINTDNDTKIMRVGAAEMERRINKDLNGRLYITVVVEEQDLDGNVLQKPVYNFILCGFRRDSNAFLSYNKETEEIKQAFYNSIMYGTKIKLNENTPLKNTEFVLGNLFYYKDYIDPKKSNLTPITPNFIIRGQDIIKVRTEPVVGNDKIFFPQACLEKGSVLEIKFWSAESSTNLQKPLIVTLIIVCVPLAVLFFILVMRAISKRRQKL